MLGLDERTLDRHSLAQDEVLFRQGDKVNAIYFGPAGRYGYYQHIDNNNMIDIMVA